MHEPQFPSGSPNFRDSVVRARERLVAGRQDIKAQHESGSPGIQVCTRLTDLLDEVVLGLYEAAIADLAQGNQDDIRSQVALVAHGGYGRRDVAPYSDVDLMILHAAGSESLAFPLASRMLRDVTDVGLDLGHSVRTPDQAYKLAAQDPMVCTSLIESRFLAGGDKLFGSFFDRFARRTRSRQRSLFHAIEQARRQERLEFGETVYLLEPNVKRSRGGLRDLQLLRWLGFARFGATDINDLQLLGAFSKEDLRTLIDASEYLLRLRNELHFHAGKSNDVLTRSEQVRLAELYGYEQVGGLLSVEQFMREYFRHTRGMRSVVSNYVATARPRPLFSGVAAALFSHRVEGDYRVTYSQIVATPGGLAKLQTDLREILKLCDLANLYNKRIAPSTWDAVRNAVPRISGEASPEVSKQFLSLISQPGRLGELLRRLHELGVLEKIIPAFEHARCLLQFNEYHKYTVDEHCILAVQRASEFIQDRSILGRVYWNIKQKRTLHLALLIHDLGKGFVEDHSEVGLRIAEETTQRLRLSVREAETVKFLVHKHLQMSHLAFWRDTSDDQVVIKFAVEVGSPEVLDMLFVLTAADFAAVGPGVWTSWKAEVLTDLYRRTMRHLSGDAAASDTAERMEARKAQIRACLARDADSAWFNRQIDALPPAYALATTPQQVAADLRELHSLAPGDVRAVGRYLNDSGTVQFVIGTHEQITPGVFHKLTGALAGQRLQILSAEINTLADGLVFDRFDVVDPDYSGPPPAARLEEVADAIVRALKTPNEAAPKFQQVWSTAASQSKAALSVLPTRVLVDNSTSDRFTILDIFACDRMGLLFTISRTIFELGLSVSIAKIGTYLDQVVDVFYVTDRQGRKIDDEGRLQEIRARLLAAIDGMNHA
jgi:[protein-PII] uridylyltransferase